MKLKLFGILLSALSLGVNAQDTEQLQEAIATMNMYATQKSAFTDRFSSSYFILYKKLHGEEAYLSQFEYLTGIADENRAALMYSAMNAELNQSQEFLIKMQKVESTWHVNSIEKFHMTNFKLKKYTLLKSR